MLKLENVYLTETLENHLYLKNILYTLKTQTRKPIEDKLEEFNMFILDLENI